MALGAVGAGAAAVAGARPSGMAALCLGAWGLAEAGAALWERLRREAAPGAALWGAPRPHAAGVCTSIAGLWRPECLPQVPSGIITPGCLGPWWRLLRLAL